MELESLIAGKFKCRENRFIVSSLRCHSTDNQTFSCTFYLTYIRSGLYQWQHQVYQQAWSATEFTYSCMRIAKQTISARSFSKPLTLLFFNARQFTPCIPENILVINKSLLLFLQHMKLTSITIFEPDRKMLELIPTLEKILRVTFGIKWTPSQTSRNYINLKKICRCCIIFHKGAIMLWLDRLQKRIHFVSYNSSFPAT